MTDSSARDVRATAPGAKTRLRGPAKDAVATVPMGLWEEWIAEGDLPGETWSGLESRYNCRPPKWVDAGARLYIVAHGKLRGYAPIVRVERLPDHVFPAIVRRSGAVAVTIAELIQGFRGIRRRWWCRSEEIEFPEWRAP
jgi:hypothetical protein